MRSAVPVAMALALAVGAGACSSKTGDSSGPAGTAVVADAPATLLRNAPTTATTGGFVTTTVRAVDPASLPPGAQRAVTASGADEIEQACIRAGIADQLAAVDGSPATGDDAASLMAGNAVIACLRPAKLGSAVAAALPDVFPTIIEEQAACVRARLGSGEETTAYAAFVGGVVTGNQVVARQGAAPVDAACATQLAG